MVRPPESKLPQNSLRKCVATFWAMFDSLLRMVVSDTKPKVAHPVMVKIWRIYFYFTSANTCNRPPDTQLPDLVIKKGAGGADAPFSDMTEGSLLRFTTVLRGQALSIFGLLRHCLLKTRAGPYRLWADTKHLYEFYYCCWPWGADIARGTG
jgi:hypothetical protein